MLPISFWQLIGTALIFVAKFLDIHVYNFHFLKNVDPLDILKLSSDNSFSVFWLSDISWISFRSVVDTFLIPLRSSTFLAILQRFSIFFRHFTQFYNISWVFPMLFKSFGPISTFSTIFSLFRLLFSIFFDIFTTHRNILNTEKLILIFCIFSNLDLWDSQGFWVWCSVLGISADIVLLFLTIFNIFAILIVLSPFFSEYFQNFVHFATFFRSWLERKFHNISGKQFPDCCTHCEKNLNRFSTEISSSFIGKKNS